MTTSTSTTAPTFSRAPEGDETTGQEAVDLAARYGIPLDPWQADIVRGILRESGGTWSASQAGLVVGRQNGKGQIIAAIELFGIVVLGEKILHTAHNVRTSGDAFRRLWAVLQHPDLAPLIRRHSQAIGAEFIELTNGARIQFSTRSASTGRGLSIDRLVVDEAEDLPAAEVAALAPTVFARPHAQSMYFGTAPGPAHDSEAFTALRRSAIDGLNPRLAWWEWCAEWGSDIDDRDVWIRVNPAVATGRVPLQAIEDDRSVLPPDAFRAERLSTWIPAGQRDAVFDEEIWHGLTDPDSTPTSDLVIALDAPPSRDYATVCIAGRRADGLRHLEWYKVADGITWTPAWVASVLDRHVRAVVVDERNPLAELDWRAARVRLTLAGSRDVATAAGTLVDAVADHDLRHRGQIELSKGILSARVRPMLGGQGIAWDRKAPGSSTLLAASLALWGLDVSRAVRPQRRAAGDASNRRVFTG